MAPGLAGTNRHLPNVLIELHQIDAISRPQPRFNGADRLREGSQQRSVHTRAEVHDHRDLDRHRAEDAGMQAQMLTA